MLENYRIRTDLALETTERFKEDNVEIRGVVFTRITIRRRIFGRQW